MPDGLNPDERRGYLQGQLSARLDGHDAHFRELNGQIGELADSSRGVEAKLDVVLAEMPRVMTVAEEAEKAKVVATALAKKTEDARTHWDRYRGVIAWVLGSIVGLTVLTNFVLNFHDAASESPPAQTQTETVTVPDITPGGTP